MAKPGGSAPDPPEESEEESSSEEENEGSDAEPPRAQNAQKPAPASASKKPQPQPFITQPADSSSDDGESESETDSDAPVKKPDPNIKPIASKPMDDTVKSSPAKNPRSKASTSGPTSPTKPTPGAGAKRPSPAAGATDGEAKEAKRSKKTSEMGIESSENDSHKLFQRIWSEDDEIAILKGMIDYQAKKKADPVADLDAFLEFIKKSLHIDVSKTQLRTKIRRLKEKYENNARKEKKGKKKVFSKVHEETSFELSKQIWGKENHDGYHKIESKKSRTKVDEREQAVKEDKDLVGLKSLEGLKGVHNGSGSSGIEGWIAKNVMEVIKGEKRAEMEEKWKKLNVEEIEIYVKKLDLMLEQTKLVLEAIKSSGH